MTMKALNTIYQSYIADEKEMGNVGEEFYQHILDKIPYYKGEPLKALYMPKLLNKEVYNIFEYAVETMNTIIGKVISQYQKDDAYRRLFEFDKRLEALILCERSYDTLVPICRYDIFLDEDTMDFKFCEINTDGTSCMEDEYYLQETNRYSPAFMNFVEDYNIQEFELFDSWVQAVMDIYSTYKYRVEHPNIAIIDFLENAISYSEFSLFREHFVKKGFETEICDIRELTYDGTHIYSKSGMRVDIIYRRAVTVDIMMHYDEIGPFIQGVKDGKVCLFGHFITQIPHTKKFFEVLFKGETRRILTGRELEFIEKHIPYTRAIETSEDFEYLLSHKDTTFIKPLDSYGARGAYAGINHTKEEWRFLIDKIVGEKYVYQEYVKPYQSKNFINENGLLVSNSYYNMTGMYVYDGLLKGFYSRGATTNIIAGEYDEVVLSTILVK